MMWNLEYHVYFRSRGKDNRSSDKNRGKDKRDSRDRDRDRDRERERRIAREEREAAREKEREEALARCQERQRERERLKEEQRRKDRNRRDDRGLDKPIGNTHISSVIYNLSILRVTLLHTWSVKTMTCTLLINRMNKRFDPVKF